MGLVEDFLIKSLAKDIHDSKGLNRSYRIHDFKSGLSGQALTLCGASYVGYGGWYMRRPNATQHRYKVEVKMCRFHGSDANWILGLALATMVSARTHALWLPYE